jgi:hypothetical protein
MFVLKREYAYEPLDKGYQIANLVVAGSNPALSPKT